MFCLNVTLLYTYRNNLSAMKKKQNKATLQFQGLQRIFFFV